MSDTRYGVTVPRDWSAVWTVWRYNPETREVEKLRVNCWTGEIADTLEHVIDEKQHVTAEVSE